MDWYNYESKLFYGMELGSLKIVLKNFEKFLKPNPFANCPIDHIEAVDRINSQLPKGVNLEVTYSSPNPIIEHMNAHLTLIDDDDHDDGEIELSNMKNLIEKANLVEYSNILGFLGIPYSEPVFYTRPYVFLYELAK